MIVPYSLADWQRAVWQDLPLHGLGLLILAIVVILAINLRIVTRKIREYERISRRYANAINVSLDAIVVADASGRVLDFNTAAERIFGYTRNAAIGADMVDMIVPETHRAAHRAGMSRVLATGETRVINRGRMTLQGLRSNGEVFPAEVSLGMTENPDGPIFTGYIRDVTDQVKAREELTQARDEALAAATAKSQFLAVMSHEMRTPLNGVLAALDILASGALDDKQRRFVEAATNSGELLQRHIDDLLQLNEMESRPVTFRRSTFSIGELVADVIAMNAAPAAANGNRLFFESELGDVYIIEDRHRLSQIVVNLVNNAVKFTQNGRIQVEVRRVAGSQGEDLIEIVVADDGAGIADEDKERIFDTFVTLDPTYRQSTRGYGLGLAICRRIARAMGGEIGVDSRKGFYSRFWVRLPFREASASAASAVFRAPAGRPFDLPSGKLALQVLLVEDDETNRLVAREMLSLFGCTVVEAHDGEEAIRAAEVEKFDLILMDVNMPNVGGLEATRRIRQSPGSRSRRTPIVGVTAHALPEEQDRLREAGMQECLIKPVRARNLQGLLRRFSDFPDEFENDESAADRATADIPCVDVSVIEELMSVFPRGTFRRQVAAFQKEVARIEDGLRTALEGDSLQTVASTAHKHAGAAAVFGAGRLREDLIKIEVAAHAGRRELISLVVETIPDLARRTIEGFDIYLQD